MILVSMMNVMENIIMNSRQRRRINSRKTIILCGKDAYDKINKKIKEIIYKCDFGEIKVGYLPSTIDMINHEYTCEYLGKIKDFPYNICYAQQSTPVICNGNKKCEVYKKVKRNNK